MKHNPYQKVIVQVVMTILAGIVAALADNTVSATEWLNVIILGLGALAVLGAGELPTGVWSKMKTYVSAGTAAAVFLVSAISDGGITTAEYIQLALAVVGTLGIAVVSGPKVVPTAGNTNRAL